jgi:hydantoinase/carbamoylase family amidase
MGADANRMIAELRELAELTGDERGAQRLAWTDTWAKARAWERELLAELGVEVDRDQAGNVWATLPGNSPQFLIIGSHIDSVPNGGWLDGCLGVLSALEVLRSLSADGPPPLTVKLVDWADEEGARFGRSLFGSSAVAGTLDPDSVRGLKDREGIALPEALAACGVDLDRVPQSGSRLSDVKAYLEVHIEQGPVLEKLGIPIGPVLGTFGVERHAVHFAGRASHAGSTPMDLRHDALACAARFALDVRESAKRRGGVATCGTITVEPSIVTAIPGTCTITLDQRCLDATALAGMLADAHEAGERIAADEGCTVTWERIWRIEPIPFHPPPIAFAEESCREVAGVAHALPSGALHDAAEMARRVPTVMMFVTSIGGVSHSPLEDTPLEHLELLVRAHAGLTRRTLAWVGCDGPSSVVKSDVGAPGAEEHKG